MKLYKQLPKEWKDFLELPENYFDSLEKELRSSKTNPSEELIFRAFHLKPDEVKVVIIGQDPYPNSEDATGLAFSVSKDREGLPASLRNIKKELSTDLNITLSKSGDLSPWCKEGVMLLNRILTTIPGKSLSHKNLGWEEFTNLVVSKLSTLDVIFILWGKNAENLSSYIEEGKKIIGTHPSPLSAHRGFFGSKPFGECNRKLIGLGRTPIDWRI